MSVVPLDPHNGLVSIERGGASPDVLMVDLRGQGSFPQDLSTFKRRHPRTGVIIVVSSLDPALMLDAMRAGVTEVVQEPVSGPDLRSAVDRVLGASAPPTEQGKV